MKRVRLVYRTFSMEVDIADDVTLGEMVGHIGDEVAAWPIGVSGGNTPHEYDFRHQDYSPKDGESIILWPYLSKQHDEKKYRDKEWPYAACLTL